MKRCCCCHVFVYISVWMLEMKTKNATKSFNTIALKNTAKVTYISEGNKH